MKTGGIYFKKVSVNKRHAVQNYRRPWIIDLKRKAWTAEHVISMRLSLCYSIRRWTTHLSYPGHDSRNGPHSSVRCPSRGGQVATVTFGHGPRWPSAARRKAFRVQQHIVAPRNAGRQGTGTFRCERLRRGRKGPWYHTCEIRWVFTYCCQCCHGCTFRLTLPCLLEIRTEWDILWVRTLKDPMHVGILHAGPLCPFILWPFCLRGRKSLSKSSNLNKCQDCS